MRRRSALTFSLLVLSACPGDDGGAGDTETSTSGDTEGTGSTMTAASMSASSASMSSSTDDTTDGSATTTTPGTSDSSDTSTASSGSDSGSVSTGVEEATYPPCDPRMDPPCPEGYDACYDVIPGYNVCNVVGCETPDDCPPADGGEAEVLCIPFEGGTCVLDCPGGLACPEGMECVTLGQSGVERCLWPV